MDSTVIKLIAIVRFIVHHSPFYQRLSYGARTSVPTYPQCAVWLLVSFTVLSAVITAPIYPSIANAEEHEVDDRIGMVSTSNVNIPAITPSCAEEGKNTNRVSIAGLLENEQLSVGQCLYIPDYRFYLILQSDGNLVLYYYTGKPLWATGTNGKSVQRAIMQSDGNFVLYDKNNVPVWATGTYGRTGFFGFGLLYDGRLVLRQDNNVIWQTSTIISTLGPDEQLLLKQSLYSPNRKYELIFDHGELVLYRIIDEPGHYDMVFLWETSTYNIGQGQAVRAVMQRDGNFVLYDKNDIPVWASGPWGRTGRMRLTLQDDGNLVIYQNDVPIWATGTYESTSPPPVTPPSPTPTPERPSIIYDRANALLTGFGFEPNKTIYIRVVSTIRGPFFGQTASDIDGRIKLPLPIACTQIGERFGISANDNRWDKANKEYLWSNVVEFTCL